MKYIFLLLIFLTACSKDMVLDRIEINDVSAEIISQDHKFGRDLKIKAKGNEFIIDVEELKAWKVDFCNVDGGEMELALGVYKKTPFDPKFDRRCFLYNIDFKNRKLKPKLRISRLYNPIVDFNLCDIDGDSYDEIISIEKNIDGNYLFGVYDWTNFAFQRNHGSMILKEEPKFLDKEKKVEINGSERELYLEGDEIKWK
ncbi:MAG: hypothetical protein E6312_00785 [Peptoniphilus grossensis]|uniref:hypothetical protein n=1 Tax=Peptoniphilus grossensis TaxID=1465756 RepID=UPI00291001D1|nr:hypothetical protein [Peptoniphilus grossensis]MDU7150587.1 hypothetical protein [Peptoniphilus grossensis]